MHKQLGILVPPSGRRVQCRYWWWRLRRPRRHKRRQCQRQRIDSCGDNQWTSRTKLARRHEEQEAERTADSSLGFSVYRLPWSATVPRFSRRRAQLAMCSREVHRCHARRRQSQCTQWAAWPEVPRDHPINQYGISIRLSLLRCCWLLELSVHPRTVEIRAAWPALPNKWHVS